MNTLQAAGLLAFALGLGLAAQRWPGSARLGVGSPRALAGPHASSAEEGAQLAAPAGPGRSMVSGAGSPGPMASAPSASPPAPLAGPGGMATIAGFLEDSEGEPISGALVHGVWALEDLRGAGRPVRTDARGAFTVLLEDLRRLSLQELDEVEAWVQVQVPRRPLWVESLGWPDEPGGRWVTTVILDAEGWLSVRCLDPGGSPVDQAELRLDYQGPEGGVRDTGDTGPDGYACFELPVPGARNLRLEARHSQVGLGGASWEEPPGTAAEVTLQPGGSIAGRVVDSEGQAVAGASVLATDWERDGDDWVGSGEVETGPDGQFALLDLEPGSFDLLVNGFDAAASVSTGTAGLELVLPLYALDVRVRGEDGAPIRGVDLEVYPVRSGPGGRVLPAGSGALASCTRVGPGAFGVLLPGPGRFGVLASLDGMQLWATAQVQAGACRELTLVLRGSPSEVEVDLQVVDDTGLPLANSALVEWRHAQSGACVLLEEAGLQRVPTGDWTLLVKPQDRQHVAQGRSVHLAPGEPKALRVVCPRGASVDVVIGGPTQFSEGMQLYLEPRGGPRGEACPALRRSGHSSSWTRLFCSGGTYELDGAFAPGTYRLQLTAEGRVELERRVTLKPGPQTLRLPDLASLR